MSETRRLYLTTMGAASGGEFYCELWSYSPRDGYICTRIATFIIPTQMTWGEAVGLVDTEERSEITVIPNPSGINGIVIKPIKKEDAIYSFLPEDYILTSDNIEVGKTYKFMYG